MAESSHP